MTTPLLPKAKIFPKTPEFSGRIISVERVGAGVIVNSGGIVLVMVGMLVGEGSGSDVWVADATTFSGAGLDEATTGGEVGMA